MKSTHHILRTMAVAVALTLPAGLSLAAPVSELVTTRDDQDIHQQFGRDSVYAIQTRQPADTEARFTTSGSSGVGEFFAGVGAAGAAAWDRVTGIFEPSDSNVAAAAQPEREMYGRAGGYVGIDQMALLERAEPAATTAEVVTTREAMAVEDSAKDVRYPAAREDQLYGSEPSEPVSDSYPNDRLATPHDELATSNDELARSSDRLAGVRNDSTGSTWADTPTMSDDVQSAPSPDVGTVEDSQLDAMTAAPTDGGDWKQPDEADAAQQQTFDRQ